MKSILSYKVWMAILGTIFVLFSVSLLSEAIFHSEAPEQPGYAIAAVEPSGGGESEGASGPEYEPVAPLLASASVDDGMSVAKKCASCHTFEQGGANKVGPNLYGVVGHAIAAHEGFSYSSAIQAYGEGKTWTYEELNGFLWNPKKHIKGTAMGFAGLKKVDERAAMIAYLRTLSDSPVPLPSADQTAESSGAPASEAPASEAPASEAPAGEASEAPATEQPAGEATTGEQPKSE